METKNGDLLIHGNLVCGDNGILEAAGCITWNFDLAPEGESKDKAIEMFKDIPEGDLNLNGTIHVNGNVYVWGSLIVNWDTYKGHISAASPSPTKV